MTYSFLRKILRVGFAAEFVLGAAVFSGKLASMEAEIDCKLQSNSS